MIPPVGWPILDAASPLFNGYFSFGEFKIFMLPELLFERRISRRACFHMITPKGY